MFIYNVRNNPSCLYAKLKYEVQYKKRLHDVYVKVIFSKNKTKKFKLKNGKVHRL